MAKVTEKKRLRTITLTNEVQDAMKQQLRGFRERFAREPRTLDPVFVDLRSDAPSAMDLDDLQREALTVMSRSCVSPELVYGYFRTGLLVTE